MKLEHISISVNPNDEPDNAVYIIRAELRGIPEKQWQDGLRFVWHNSPYYLCNRSELTIEGNSIELVLENSGNIQNAIDTLSSSIVKAGKMVRSTGISYISNYRMKQVKGIH
ncbi:MAG: hypothetical protein GX045_03815 [Clostridiaceae bacterium]|jgi:hypothetical protein|nr:hypothetical protein [Clostridiaceae bacterium]